MYKKSPRHTGDSGNRINQVQWVDIVFKKQKMYSSHEHVRITLPSYTDQR